MKLSLFSSLVASSVASVVLGDASSALVDSAATSGTYSVATMCAERQECKQSNDVLVQQGQGEKSSGGLDIYFRNARLSGYYSVMQGTVPPNGLLAFHMHQNEDQHMYIMNGELQFELGGGRRFSAKAGDHILKPRKISHGFWNLGNETVHYVETSTEGGFEQFIDNLALGLVAFVQRAQDNLDVSFQFSRSVDIMEEFNLTALAGIQLPTYQELFTMLPNLEDPDVARFIDYVAKRTVGLDISPFMPKGLLLQPPLQNEAPADVGSIPPVSDLRVTQSEGEATATDVVVYLRSPKLAGFFSVLQGTIPAGGMSAFRTHNNQDQHMFILNGELHFEVGGGRRFTAKAGDHILKPRKISHGFWNLGNEAVHYVETSTADGFEQFIDRLGDGSYASFVDVEKNNLGISFQYSRTMQVMNEFSLSELTGANLPTAQDISDGNLSTTVSYLTMADLETKEYFLYHTKRLFGDEAANGVVSTLEEDHVGQHDTGESSKSSLKKEGDKKKTAMIFIALGLGLLHL